MPDEAPVMAIVIPTSGRMVDIFDHGITESIGWSCRSGAYNCLMRWQSLVTASAIIAVACILGGGDDSYPAVPAALGTPDPARLLVSEDEPATPAQVALGRQLFFDPRLSGNGTISCATCHDPARGFADGMVTGLGAHGERLSRNTPGLTNVGFGTRFYWDGRAESLEEQALGPITNPHEMDLPREQIVPRLQQIKGYRDGFAAAFKDGLNVDSVTQALAAFQRTLISRDSPFDRYAAGDREALSPEARRGMVLFAGEANCVICHHGPNFTNDSFHNIGLKDQSDPGRAAIQPGASLQAAFKTPTLRNVALTAPYFHDGSATTLEQVIRIYDQGGLSLPRDPLLTGLGLRASKQRDLVAFLHALTAPISVTRPVLPADEP